MGYCSCGGKLGRVHRTFRERLVYLAVYECQECHAKAVHRRGFMFYLGDETRCPLCGTNRLHRLIELDRIDRYHRNLFSLLRFVVSVQLYHCRICRIQFYDIERNHTQKAVSQSG